MTSKTLTIGGHAFELVKGRRYLASRPMITTAGRGQKFDVTIADVTDGFSYDRPAVAVVRGLTYAQANDLLATFNNDEVSIAGRFIG